MKALEATQKEGATNCKSELQASAAVARVAKHGRFEKKTE